METRLILIFCCLYRYPFTGCTNNKIESKTVTAGETVRLDCPRTTSGTHLWIRVVPGNLPEFLGKSLKYNYDRFTTKTNTGTLELVINNLHVIDAGVYFCMTQGKRPQFLKRIDLTVGKCPACVM